MNKISYNAFCAFNFLRTRIRICATLIKVYTKFYFQAFLFLIKWPSKKPVEDCGFTLEELQEFVEAYEKCPKEPLPVSFFKEVGV